MTEWMIYGANGYTGELIAREARAQGLSPVLAGRNRPAIDKLGQELGLPTRVFDLDAPQLQGTSLVLNCAGPFSVTGRPMIDACVKAGAHYLDITGELGLFEYAHAQDQAAREARVVLCPGVGFDVIPTDCVARALHEALPSATHLALGFETRSTLSPGTSKTTVEGIAKGGWQRRNGKLAPLTMGSDVRKIDFGNGVRTAMAFPWGDISTAFFTTGIPNIRVYLSVPPRMVWGVRLTNIIAPLLGLPAVQRHLQKRAGQVQGPDQAARAATPSYVWGEARDAAGQICTARVKTANGYDVTVHGAIAVVRHMLDTGGETCGYYTPSRLCGVDLISKLPGSGRIAID